MKKGLASRLANPLIVAGMALALALLAGLQYRWIGELSGAEKARLERTLEASARRFRGEFNRRLQRFSADLTPDFRRLTPDSFQEVTSQRIAAARVSEGLRVQTAWIRRFDLSGEAPLLRLGSGGRAWEAVDIAAPEVPMLISQPVRSFGRRGFGGGRPSSWSLLAEGPYLVHPLLSFARAQGRQRPDILGLLFVELNAAAIRDELFPALFAEAFGELEELRYQAIVLEEGPAPRLVYASDGDARIDDFTQATLRLPLLWNREEAEGRGPGGRPPGFRPNEGGPPERRPGDGGPGDRRRGDPSPSDGGFAGLDGTDSPVSPGPGPEWIFMVRHRAGSLDAVVARLRRRNLVISGGILALLIAGMAAVLVSTRRAQRLAEMQMDFVAGVSHDLRTPLAVIRSAGDNLAEGVVSTDEQVREYGRLVRSEGRRLTGMVEQTLQFAAVQAGKRQYRIQPIAAAELIRQAVDEAQPTAEEAGFTIELDLPERLPAVDVDSSAASQILQNLIGNAVKYGGEARWVGVSARAVDGGVAIEVRDRGPGVDPQELPRIFEPFFRGRHATEQQIKGSGLGLALARSDAEGFGGKLTVERRPGEGAAFTLWMPAAKESETA